MDLSASFYHTCAVLNTGQVRCWGLNFSGTAGTAPVEWDNFQIFTEPQVVEGVTDAVAVAAGYSASCALTIQGRVLCWGEDSMGRIGDGLPYLNGFNPPTQPVGLSSGVVRLSNSARGYHTCALKEDGTVLCWGDNTLGQIGQDNSQVGQEKFAQPTIVQGVQNVTAISTGIDHTCAVQADNVVKCWGGNGFGQLGDETTIYRFNPAPVVGINYAQVTEIHSNMHNCLRTIEGNLKCWGLGGAGQLGGDGALSRQPLPVLVSQASSNVSQLKSGDWHLCLLTTAGQVNCWGNNSVGQLGTSSHTPYAIPHPVPGLESGVQEIRSGAEFACALTSASAVVCWGAITNSPYTPQSLDSGVAQLELGSDHSCVRMQTGEVRCWGGNWVGQAGAPGTETIEFPTTVEGLATGIEQIALGRLHSCALKDDQTVWCWGSASLGQLGDGITQPTHSPVQVSLAGEPLTDVVDLQARWSHNCATRSDNSTVCWGDTEFISLWQPGLVDQVGDVSYGRLFTCYITNTGGVKCKGLNTFGQLGNGNYQNQTDYIDVQGLDGVVEAIDSGLNHTCALLDDGRVQCWGADDFGQLGDNNQPYRPYAVNVTGFSANPELGVNYTTGAPGSSFRIMGNNFPPGSAVDLFANGSPIGTPSADELGQFTIIIDTPPDDSGYYTITGQVHIPLGARREEAPLEDSPSLTLRVGTIYPNRPREGTTTIFSLQAGLANNIVFIPMIVR